MRTVDILLVVVAALMLVRNGPRAVALLRGNAQGRLMAIVSLVNVLLALVLLVMAVKGFPGGIISR
jgi:hypothetical protein